MRDLTKLGQELESHNQAVENAQQARRAWMERNYLEFAEFRIGDKIYAEVAANDYRLQPAGVVTAIYLKFDPANPYPAKVPVYYRFDADPSYLYGVNTEGTHARFYPESQDIFSIEQLREWALAVGYRE